MADQTKTVYDLVKECKEMIEGNHGYALSFTGYSFGAWLAEQAVFFCHRDYNMKEVRAVTFDSPGSFNYLTLLNTCNVMSNDTLFNLFDLDVVTYLSEPNFVNTANAHLGTVYYLGSQKFESEDDDDLKFTDDILAKIPDIVKTKDLKQIKEKLKNKLKEWFDNKIKANVKAYGFYLKGLRALFSNGHRAFLSRFDDVTQQPKVYVRVLDWPRATFNPTAVMKDNYKSIFCSLAEKICGLLPGLPSTVQEAASCLLTKAIAVGGGLVFDNYLGGFVAIANFLIEVFVNNNIDHTQCKEFYKNVKIMLTEATTTPVSGCIRDGYFKVNSFDHFNLKYVAHYRVTRVDLSRVTLSEIKYKSIEYYMDKMQTKSKCMIKNPLTPVEKQIVKVTSLYNLTHPTPYEFVIEINKQFNNYGLQLTHVKACIRWLIWNNAELKLKEYIDDEANKVALPNEIVVEKVLKRRIEFVCRAKELKQILDIVLSEKKKPIVVIWSEKGGMGKSTLANEIGYKFCEQTSNEKGKCVASNVPSASFGKICEFLKEKLAWQLWKSDYDQNITCYENFIHKIRCTLSQLLKTHSFLFILDNVENYCDVLMFLVEFLQMDLQKCKFIVTSRNQHILTSAYYPSEMLCHMRLDPFDRDQAIIYLEKKFTSHRLTNFKARIKVALERIDSNKCLYSPQVLDTNMNVVSKIPMQGIDKKVSEKNIGIYGDKEQKQVIEERYYMKERRCLIMSQRRYSLDESSSIRNILVRSNSSMFEYQTKPWLNHDFFGPLDAFPLKVIAYCSFLDADGVPMEFIRLLFGDLSSEDMEKIVNQLNKTGLVQVDTNKYTNVETLQMHRNVKKQMLDYMKSYSGLDRRLGSRDTVKKMTLLRNTLELFYNGKNEHVKWAFALYLLGDPSKSDYSNLRMSEECLTCLIQAYDIQTRFYNSQDHADIAKTLFALAQINDMLNHNEKAIEWASLCFEMQKRLYGKGRDNPDLIEKLRILISLSRKLRKLDEEKKWTTILNDTKKRLQRLLANNSDVCQPTGCGLGGLGRTAARF